MLQPGQSNTVSLRRVALGPDVVRPTLDELPLPEATMGLADAVTALPASELIALHVEKRRVEESGGGQEVFGPNLHW